MNLMQWVDEFPSLLAPPRCACCARPEPSGLVCANCKPELPWNLCACPSCAQPLPAVATCANCLKRAPSFDSAWTPFVFEDPVRQSVLRLKYGARFEQARVLGQLMAQALQQRDAPLPRLLIPVPLPRTRLYTRGYNQAMELARTLQRVLGLPIDHRCARLLRAPRDQIGQTAAQRRRNLREAFVVDRDLCGVHIGLIDDVMTTGATLDALARAARKAGAARIEAWALARAP
ncbi:MAG: ComF family protein [Panacagrimonas sp.]